MATIASSYVGILRLTMTMITYADVITVASIRGYDQEPSSTSSGTHP